MLAVIGMAFITLNFMPGFHRSEVYIISHDELNEWLIKPDGSNIPVNELFSIPPPTMPLHSEMVPNGNFMITFFDTNEKEIIGYPIYADEFIRKQSVEIPKNASMASITKKNGNASHIDAILSGSGNISFSKNTPEETIKQLSEYDGDLANLNSDGLFVSFNEHTTTIDLYGRIEGELLTEPFHYPEVNFDNKAINSESAFYKYSPMASQKVDGFSDESCFKKFFTIPGSGHPMGYTYVWAWNDDEYLYLKMDITCDNTNDNDGDYSTIHIKDGDDILSFKINSTDSPYGSASFGYTDKINYAHKFYDFKIDASTFSDLRNIKLAFEFYGTVAPPPGTQIQNIGSITDNSAVVSFSSGPLTNQPPATTGIVWNTTGMPTYESHDGITSENHPSENYYIHSATGLTPGQTYYVRSYIDYSPINAKADTEYSPELTFTTTGGLPTPLSNWPLIAGGILLALSAILAFRKRRTT